MNNTWNQYRQTGIKELRPYVDGEDLTGVSISDFDKANGSPKLGDMIGRNPEKHTDRWLVAQAYFEKNLELIGPCAEPLTYTKQELARMTGEVDGFYTR